MSAKEAVVFPNPIDCIADQRVPEPSQMPSNLMTPSCANGNADKGIASARVLPDRDRKLDPGKHFA